MNCLHPISIRHPTVEKFKSDNHDLWYFKLHLSDAEVLKRIDEFCKIHSIDRILQIPCGKCLYCYQRKQEVWRIRLQQEMKSSFCCYFATLTYNDDDLPKDGVSKTDVQKFFKRFRHNLCVSVRYFGVSEYGPKGTRRPHYHFALFFNDYISFDDCLFELERSWHSIVSLGDLTDGRIQYLSTYCIKFFNEAPVGQNVNFMLCSRRPFIGHGFLDSEMCDNLRFKMVPYVQVNGFKKPMPRIYKEKIFDDEQVIQLREKMQSHQSDEKEKMINFYGSELDYEKAMRYQAKLDYKKAWRKFKESKKL